MRTPEFDQGLWNRLEAMDLDNADAVLPLSRRLARDNGWTQDFAKRVIDEYKRFVYLAMTAGVPVTPSDEVDQAWHLHLCYTRHYWDTMCGEILGRPLHHGPTKGGQSESTKYRDWYGRTLELYEDAFGEAAPRDIWPVSDDRFRDVEAFRRVNTNKQITLSRAAAKSGVLGAAALILAGCTESLDLEDMFFIATVIIAVVLIFKWLNSPPGPGGKGGGGGGGCATCGGCGGCGGCS